MRPTLRTGILFLSLLLTPCILTPVVAAAAESSGGNKAGANQGFTLDEIGKGLKSAAKNVEEEIPKIGPAIGKTFKQVTGSGKDTSTSKEPPQGSKPKK